MSADSLEVARLLDASRREHERYRQHMPRMSTVPGGYPIPQGGSPDDARAALVDARNLRVQAHNADPDHTAPAWASDVVPHDELMAYYAQQLA
jgi:hypothetical protein